MPDQQLVFVGGLHRSGTTPLAKALSSHPDVSGLTGTGVFEDEGHHLQDVYPRIRKYGGMGRFANSPDAHLTEKSALVSAQNAQRLLRAWEPYWNLNAAYLLEKTPSNLIMGRFLQALFPESHLIVSIRHPVAVALALQKWNPWVFNRKGRRRVTLPDMVGHWLRAHDILRDDAPHLARLHVVRYEDLVSKPDTELMAVQESLGLVGEIPRGLIRQGLSQRYQDQWDAMRSGNPLARRARRLIEERYSDRIAAHGYDVSDVRSVVAPWPRTHRPLAS